MTTGATKLENNDENFKVYTRGTSDYLHGLILPDCPYPERTLKADIWELAWGRAQFALKNNKKRLQKLLEELPED